MECPSYILRPLIREVEQSFSKEVGQAFHLIFDKLRSACEQALIMVGANFWCLK